MTPQITGRDAIRYAHTHGALLCKSADPTEGARSGLTAEEAGEICAVDPGLIYCEASDTVTVDYSTRPAANLPRWELVALRDGHDPQLLIEEAEEMERTAAKSGVSGAHATRLIREARCLREIAAGTRTVAQTRKELA